MRSLTRRVRAARSRKTPQRSGTTPIAYGRDGIYSGTLFGGSPRDRDAQLRAPETNGLLFSIVNRTSTAVAALNWRLYRKTPNPNTTSERTEVQVHAVLDLLASPNTHMDGPQLFEQVQQHIDLTGEGYLIVVRHPSASIPIELWPVMPSRMEPVPSSTQFLAGWMYQSPTGEQVPLDTDDVIQLKTPNPRDPYRGLGPVQAMLTELDSYRYSVEWNRNFFANSAQPGGVIQLDKTMDDEQFSEFVDRWNEQHKGVSRAHRVAVLEEATWVPTQITMRDMQFAELQTQSRDRLLEAFGMSGSVLGVTEDVNRANAEAGKAMFAELLTKPRGVRWRGALNSRLLPMYGAAADELELDFDSPMPADVQMDNATRTSKTNAAATLVAAGWDPDDVLEAMELPPMRFKAPKVVAPTILPGEPSEGDDEAGGDAAKTDIDGLPTDRLRLRNADQQQGDDPQHRDLQHVEQLYQAALRIALAAYLLHILPGQRAQLAQGAADAVREGHVRDLGQLRIDTTSGAEELMRHLPQLAADAAAQAVEEVRAHVGVDISAAQPDHDELATIAAVTADLLAADLAASAGRQALHVWAPGVTAQAVHDAVLAHLEGLSDAGPTQHIGAAVHGVINLARSRTMISSPHGPDGQGYRLYASEVMDKNTCGPCSSINGQLIGTTTDADIDNRIRAMYPAGGYVNCLGGDRCRGTIVPAPAGPPPRSAPAQPDFSAAWSEMIAGLGAPIRHTNGHGRELVGV